MFKAHRVFSCTLLIVGFLSLAGCMSSQTTSDLDDSKLQTESSSSIRVITINVGAFFFEGPDGRSSSHDNPAVIAIIKNGERVRFIFKNVATIDHEVISPLFRSPLEIVRDLHPGRTAVVQFTPFFRSVDDGTVFDFEVACHEEHGTPEDHYFKGMRAIIRVQK
ncbi:hypothetical protein HY009_10435 [Candidatus Acetothermia bacterium]|nr:hypothetical protein [Candidatus Acetothermia bacterium]